jgi:hypothetical protein
MKVLVLFALVIICSVRAYTNDDDDDDDDILTAFLEGIFDALVFLLWHAITNWMLQSYLGTVVLGGILVMGLFLLVTDRDDDYNDESKGGFNPLTMLAWAAGFGLTLVIVGTLG